MLVLLTGEGPTDIGTATDDKLKAPGEWTIGPVSLLIRDYVADAFNLDNLSLNEHFWFAPKQYLTKLSKTIRPQILNRLSVSCSLEERKRTRALLAVALHLAEQQNDDVLPILFRDCDNALHARKRCDELRTNIQDASKFNTCVQQFVCPLIARPSSETWFVCALCYNYDEDKCKKLETSSSRSDKGKLFPKDILKNHLGNYTAQTLCDLVCHKNIRPLDIHMPSIDMFYADMLQTGFRKDETACISSSFKANTLRAIRSM